MTFRPRVLVAPLDWGLGHASRCIPLIELLLRQPVQVVLGGAGDSLLLLRRRYPDLPFYELPAYDVRYPRHGGLVAAVLWQIPRLRRVIRKEHAVLEALAAEGQIDAVISDNRYGLWSAQIPSVCVCHQIAPLPPPWIAFLQPLVRRMHQRQLRRFREVWIPDREGEDALAGRLAHGFPLPDNYHFVGPLSRFAGGATAGVWSRADLPEQVPEVAAVLSGPEPQRSMLEAALLRSLPQGSWIVQGLPAEQDLRLVQGIWLVPFLETADLRRLLCGVKRLIARPGYSSLMDFAALGIRNVTLIPTPGQTEQLYLAKWLSAQNIACYVNQPAINVQQLAAASGGGKGFHAKKSEAGPENEAERFVINFLYCIFENYQSLSLTTSSSQQHL
ncbi:MAG: hypothetical protein EAZ89_13315 [Bacteroidetes bacterium]|nr:MAG: hypothetical protein EAZ89_13315 [Bacteroidota bacterium]